MTIKEWATKEHRGARVSAVQNGNPAKAHIDGKGWIVVPEYVDQFSLDKELFDGLEKRFLGIFGA